MPSTEKDLTTADVRTLAEIESMVVRFTGDSGDGSQLIGNEFANTSAIVGNDISTQPDFPAEIRAPAGTLPGVSGFQVNISSHPIFTPGDKPQVLVAMNPASLKANIEDLAVGGAVIVDTDNFTEKNLRKAGYRTNPLLDESLSRYRAFRVPLNTLHKHAVKQVEGLTNRQIEIMKNMFALGLAYWIFDRPMEPTIRMIERKFSGKPAIAEGNVRTMKAGYHYGETTEIFQHQYKISKAPVQPGTYRTITGNQAIALGFVTAARQANKTLFYGSYPITPASSILEQLAKLGHFDVRTFQAEDEIAAMGAVIGAAFGGAFAATATSGPGVALKSEAINLAVAMELPLVVTNVQRGGPSTGLPTKTEQSDLLQCLFGRNGESPIPVLAAATPTDCFSMAIEAFRIAVESMTPVFLLSDGYLANTSEPWRIPDPDTIKPIKADHPTDPEGFQPYSRDTDTLARPWAIPGTPGLEHRLGGLEKQDITGNVSYDPRDHQHVVDMRAAKVAAIADRIPAQQVIGPHRGELLVVGWGSTYGAIRTAVQDAQRNGQSVALAHLNYINPLPRNLGRILSRYDKVLVPELNSGQLALLLNAQFPLNVISLTKVEGKSFKISEIRRKIDELQEPTRSYAQLRR